MDRGAWWATVHGVTQSQIGLTWKERPWADTGKMAVYTARTGTSEEASLAGSWILDFWLPEL